MKLYQGWGKEGGGKEVMEGGAGLTPLIGGPD
jgi:hypothetical protein